MVLLVGCTSGVSVTPEERCLNIFEEYLKSNEPQIGEKGLLEGLLSMDRTVSSMFEYFDKFDKNDCTLKTNKKETRLFYKDKWLKTIGTPLWMGAESIDENEYAYFPTRLGNDKPFLDENTCCGHAE